MRQCQKWNFGQGRATRKRNFRPSAHGQAGIGAGIGMHICARRQAAVEAESWQLGIDKLQKLWYNKA